MFTWQFSAANFDLSFIQIVKWKQIGITLFNYDIILFLLFFLTNE